MLHLFPRFADSVEDTPLAAELRRLGVPHRFFAVDHRFRYRTILGLLLRAYPQLFWLALRDAVRSLLLSRPRPTAVVLNSDVEVLTFGLVRALSRLRSGPRAKIVFQTLIITPKSSGVRQRLHRSWLRLVLSFVDLGIVHARYEIERYEAEYPRLRGRLRYVPYGTTVTGREGLRAAATAVVDPAVVAAGRSGRDYGTLAEAARDLPCRVVVICDLEAAVAPLRGLSNVTVLRDCFGDDYLRALAEASFVVLPLSMDAISTGQMVLLQASALGKAMIVTRTATTLDYATDGDNALLVGLGDAAGLRAAMRRLIDDPALRDRLGRNAAARFEREHSTEAYVRQLVAAVDAA